MAKLRKHYGKLTVIRFSHQDKHGKYRWLCKCTCGGMSTPSTNNLNSGNSTSCGCETHKKAGEAVLTHGHTRQGRWTKEYTAWVNMKSRCYCTSHKQYKDYGGRGITVCREWLRSFETFFAHIGPAPTQAHTLDRIKNNHNYRPGNVRWATRREQRLNSRPKSR